MHGLPRYLGTCCSLIGLQQVRFYGTDYVSVVPGRCAILELLRGSLQLSDPNRFFAQSNTSELPSCRLQSVRTRDALSHLVACDCASNPANSSCARVPHHPFPWVGEQCLRAIRRLSRLASSQPSNRPHDCLSPPQAASGGCPR